MPNSAPQRKNIFIDTSIFRKENFLYGRRIKEFLRLCSEDYFQLVLPLIVVNEIRAQYEKAIEIAKQAHNEIINSKKLDVFKNSLLASHVAEKCEKKETLTTEFNSLLDNELTKANCLILPYPTIDLTDTLDDYFNNRFPFNRGEKKHEFPDAFSIKQLEDWCHLNKTKCIVFSNDGDFLKTKSKYLEIKGDYGDFIDSYLKEIEANRIKLFESIFDKNEKKINKEIQTWFLDHLDNDTIYYTNGFDIHDIDVKSVKIKSKNYQITGIDEENIQVEITVKARVKVELVVDDENTGIWDSEDKFMSYLDTTIATVNEDCEITIKASAFIASNGDYLENIELEEFNDGKDFEFGEFTPGLWSYDY